MNHIATRTRNAVMKASLDGAERRRVQMHTGMSVLNRKGAAAVPPACEPSKPQAPPAADVL